jgi:hypothetical protein
VSFESGGHQNRNEILKNSLSKSDIGARDSRIRFHLLHSEFIEMSSVPVFVKFISSEDLAIWCAVGAFSYSV